MSDTKISPAGEMSKNRKSFVQNSFTIHLNKKDAFTKRDKVRISHKQQLLALNAINNRGISSTKITNVEIVAANRCLAPNVSEVTLVLGTPVVDVLIMEGSLTEEPNLKIDCAFDGSSLEIEQSIEINDIRNIIIDGEFKSPSYHINSFLKSVNKKDLKYIPNFKKLINEIRREVTDIQILKGSISNGTDTQSCLIMNVFCGDRYILNYNNFPAKSLNKDGGIDFKPGGKVVVARKINRSRISTNTLPISTIGKKPPSEIRNLMRLNLSSTVLGYQDNNQDNNLNSDSFEVSSLRELVGVI